jgi:hypothetical protein
MYRVLVFMENEIPKIAEELNKVPGTEVITTWSTGNRIVFVVKNPKADFSSLSVRPEDQAIAAEPRKRGRPTNKKETIDTQE